MAYPVADEVKYARQRQQQQQRPGRQHYENRQPVIGESTFPISARIDLSADFDSGAHYTPSYGDNTRQQRLQAPQIQERSPPLDTSTLMKMYYHGESTVSGLTEGRLQYADLERLQSQLESRDQLGDSSREDSTSILPRLSAPRDMDQASYDVQVARLEQEYHSLEALESDGGRKVEYILKVKRALQFCVLMFTAKIRYRLPPRPLLQAGTLVECWHNVVVRLAISLPAVLW